MCAYAQEKLKAEESEVAGPEKQLEEKLKELEEVKEKAQEQLEKVHEVKCGDYNPNPNPD